MFECSLDMYLVLSLSLHSLVLANKGCLASTIIIVVCLSSTQRGFSPASPLATRDSLSASLTCTEVDVTRVVLILCFHKGLSYDLINFVYAPHPSRVPRAFSEHNSTESTNTNIIER